MPHCSDDGKSTRTRKHYCGNNNNDGSHVRKEDLDDEIVLFLISLTGSEAIKFKKTISY